MLNIDQVKLLESKVLRAVELIKKLSDEKDFLKEEMAKKEARISELENLLLAFKDDQIKIEEKIINALNELSAFEDSVYIEKENISSGSVMAEVEKYNQNNSAENTGADIIVSDDTGKNTAKENELQKDLDDVLGNNPSESQEKEEVNTQLDIF